MSINKNKKLHFAFFGTPYEGHVTASMLLVKGLVEQENKVTYFNTKKFESMIKSSGAIFTKYKFNRKKNKSEKNIIIEITPTTTKELDETSIDDALEIIPFIFKNYPKDYFDAVIYDQYAALWGQPIAQAYNLPSFGSNTMFFRTVEEVINDLPSFVPLVDRAYKNKLKTLNKYYKLHSYKNVLELNNCLKCDGTILYSSRYLQPNSDNLHEKKFIFLGNRFKNQNYKIHHKPLQNGSTLYVSLGTLFNTNHQLFYDIMDALREKPYKIIISTGNSEEVFEALKKKPYPNVYVYKYVNQLQVLRTASLFISHAGSNSLYESLYCRTPLIMIPQMEEQHMNAVRIQALGGGYLLDLRSVSNVKHSINEAVAQIENNLEKYRLNINKIRKSFLQSDDVRAVVDKMKKLVEDKTLKEVPIIKRGSSAKTS